MECKPGVVSIQTTPMSKWTKLYREGTLTEAGWQSCAGARKGGVLHRFLCSSPRVDPCLRWLCYRRAMA
jgi:hypothetical protein